MMGSIGAIESLGLVDGPGVRCVVFLNGCALRCLYCHNPEMWGSGDMNYTVIEIVNEILRYKPYFSNGGGVTFSGGDPLLQVDFLIEVCKKLKEEDVHIALDTSGVGFGAISELLSLIDLVILDIKHIYSKDYFTLTGYNIDTSLNFINILNKSNCEVWIRQVIVSGMTDGYVYLSDLKNHIKCINNVSKVEFLGYHKLGDAKYLLHNIDNPMSGVLPVNESKVLELYEYFNKL